jgi:hypothetical protein
MARKTCAALRRAYYLPAATRGGGREATEAPGFAAARFQRWTEPSLETTSGEPPHMKKGF